LEAEKQYTVKIPANIEVEYDKQNDILYIHFDPEETPEEEWLSEEGDVILGFKDNKLIVIQILKFSEKIGGYIL
jgi:uncharacterized protein YuzE